MTAAPVVDEARRPIGIVSWRDLLPPNGGVTVGACMTRAVEVVHPDDRIEHAAMTLAAGGFHRAPVVDRDGALVGFVSALDLLRAFVGQPAAHPDTFPHWDAATGAAWTDELALSDARIDAAPRGPGVVYIEGGRDASSRAREVAELVARWKMPSAFSKRRQPAWQRSGRSLEVFQE